MTPKQGDKFKLVNIEWEVTHLGDLKFKSEGADRLTELWLSYSDADKLDWLTPTPKISREAVEHEINLKWLMAIEKQRPGFNVGWNKTVNELLDKIREEAGHPVKYDA